MLLFGQKHPQKNTKSISSTPGSLGKDPFWNQNLTKNLDLYNKKSLVHIENVKGDGVFLYLNFFYIFSKRRWCTYWRAKRTPRIPRPRAKCPSHHFIFFRWEGGMYGVYITFVTGTETRLKKNLVFSCLCIWPCRFFSNFGFRTILHSAPSYFFGIQIAYSNVGVSKCQKSYFSFGPQPRPSSRTGACRPFFPTRPILHLSSLTFPSWGFFGKQFMPASQRLFLTQIFHRISFLFFKVLSALIFCCHPPFPFTDIFLLWQTRGRGIWSKRCGRMIRMPWLDGSFQKAELINANQSP